MGNTFIFIFALSKIIKKKKKHSRVYVLNITLAGKLEIVKLLHQTALLLTFSACREERKIAKDIQMTIFTLKT